MGQVRDLEVSGLFFAIGHEPATKFLGGQLSLTEEKYVRTEGGSTTTSVDGVFAAGDVQDKKWRQAITAAGTGHHCSAYSKLWFYVQSIRAAPSGSPVLLTPNATSSWHISGMAIDVYTRIIVSPQPMSIISRYSLHPTDGVISVTARTHWSATF